MKELKKKLRDLDGCEDDDAKKTFYTQRTPHRNHSRDRNHFRDRNHSRDRNQGYNRSQSRGRRDGSYHSNRNNSRPYSQERKEGNKSPIRSFQKDGNLDRTGNYQKDGKPSNVGNTPKRTYHVTLKIDNERSIFENEVENKALVDSGCPEMVAGLSWLKTYESSQDKEFERVRRSDTFQMGDTVFKTIMFKRIPINIGGHEEELEVGIINTEIPLLISKKKLKEWGGKIDFEDNTLHIRKTGKTIQMEERSTGHLVIKQFDNLTL